MTRKRQQIIDNLPSDHDELRAQQGWDDASMIVLFEQFIEDNKLQEKWSAFLIERAADEIEGL